MTKEEFRRLRKSIGYSQAKLAKEMDLFVRTVTRWETGEIAVPKVAALALRHIVAAKRKEL